MKIRILNAYSMQYISIHYPTDFCLDWPRTKAVGDSWLETLFRFSKPALRGFPEVPACFLGLSESRYKGSQTQTGKELEDQVYCRLQEWKHLIKKTEKEQEKWVRRAQLCCSRKTTQHNCGVAGKPHNTTQLCCGRKTTQYKYGVAVTPHHTTQLWYSRKTYNTTHLWCSRRPHHTRQLWYSRNAQHDCGVVGRPHTAMAPNVELMPWCHPGKQCELVMKSTFPRI